MGGAAPATPAEPKRIVLATFGSLGDLNPYMAIALEWQRRGHRATIATSGLYRTRIEDEGVGFAPVRPDIGDIERATEVVRRAFDPRRGPEYLVRQVIMPHLRQSYDDLTAASAGADLIVSHPLTFAASLVAEKQGLVWVSSVLSPMSMWSAHDPPVVAAAPGLTRLRPLGPGFLRLLLRLIKPRLRPWTEPVRALRQEIGLPPTRLDPLFEGQFSPTLNLALFPGALAAPQPDWPPNTVVTGCPAYDRPRAQSGLSPELQAFLDAGPPPIVFALGSSAVMTAGDFYAQSLAAAARLGKRAVLVVGAQTGNRPAGPLPDDVIAAEYAPFSLLFPRAAVIVHQGGIGTTCQAMRASRPMLVVPFAFDQPDNAERLAKLGVAMVVPRPRYTADRAAHALRRLLAEPSFGDRAQVVGAAARAEDGARAACDQLERALMPRDKPQPS